MPRIAKALSASLPPGYKTTRHLPSANLVVIYATNLDATTSYVAKLLSRGQKYIIVQCCPPSDQWYHIWKSASLVWSYYNLHTLASECGFRFYRSPLGIDSCFLSTFSLSDDELNLDNRLPSVVTCGRISNHAAEPIEEVWIAAARHGIPVTHVGPPSVSGISRDYPNVTFSDPSDSQLTDIYLRSRWVAAMRHTEGFELPAVQALACGSRPIMFDQPNLRHWYGDLCTYVPDTYAMPLTNFLSTLFFTKRPVTQHERLRARARFNWADICDGFWNQVYLSQRDGIGPPKTKGTFYRIGNNLPTTPSI